MKGIFDFIAVSKCFALEVSGANENETERHGYMMLVPFITGFDSETGTVKVDFYQRNTEKLRGRIMTLVSQLEGLNPRIHRLYDYFEKELKPDEWFYLGVDEDLTQEKRDAILRELSLAVASGRDCEIIDRAFSTLRHLQEVYDIQVYNNFTQQSIGEKDKQKRVCRYCRKSMPDVTFKSVAHTISEALGNKSIVTNDECDDCNSVFGQTIEQDFLSLFDIPRLFYNIKGKNGIPRRFKGENYIIERGDAGELRIKHIMEDAEKEKAAEGIFEKFVLTPPRPFPEQNIYKCLAKYVMGVLDDETLKHFDRTRRWVRNEQVETSLPKIARFYHPEIARHPHLVVYIRKPGATDKLPHVVAELKVINLVFVYILPFSDQDTVDFTDENQFDVYWDFFGHYNKIEGWQFIECNSLEPKNPTIVLRFKHSDKPE